RRHPRRLPMTALRSAVVVIATLVLAIAPIAAHGDDARTQIPAKARTLADRGRAAHDAGDYRSAIVAFTHAYVMAPSPALLFTRAQAYRLQGNCDAPALMYRRFLATTPGPEQRALAETHLAAVERCMHKIALHIPVETTAARPIAPPSAPPPAPPLRTVAAAPASNRAQIEKDVGVGL